MDKKYIEEQYKLALSDFQIAKTEDEKWEARKTMALLEELASENFGFSYTESLRKEMGL